MKANYKFVENISSLQAYLFKREEVNLWGWYAFKLKDGTWRRFKRKEPLLKGEDFQTKFAPNWKSKNLKTTECFTEVL